MKRHKCPRCQEFTDEKFYCRPCRDSLKKPPMATKSRIFPHQTEYRDHGKSY